MDTLSTLGLLLRVGVSLSVVVGLMWITARLLRAKGGTRGLGMLEVVGRTSLGRGSAVAVVRVADRVLVLGVTERAVSFLAEADLETIETARTEQRPTGRPDARAAGSRGPATVGGPGTVTTSSALEGSLLARSTWRRLVDALRDRTARR